jgi:hypothetical protein
MLAVTITWILLAFVFLGLGLMVRHLLRVPGPQADGSSAYFFIGWGASIVFLELWHLFYRVDWRALLILALIGGLGVIWGAGDLRTWLHRCHSADTKIALYSILAAVLATLWLSNQAIGPPHNYDTGLYHLTAIRWARRTPSSPASAIFTATLPSTIQPSSTWLCSRHRPGRRCRATWETVCSFSFYFGKSS